MVWIHIQISFLHRTRTLSNVARTVSNVATTFDNPFLLTLYYIYACRYCVNMKYIGTILINGESQYQLDIIGGTLYPHKGFNIE